MSNPFKEIEKNEEPSKELRQKVLGNIDNVKLTLDFADLFLVISPQIISTLFKDNKK